MRVCPRCVLGVSMTACVTAIVFFGSSFVTKQYCCKEDIPGIIYDILDPPLGLHRLARLQCDHNGRWEWLAPDSGTAIG